MAESLVCGCGYMCFGMEGWMSLGNQELLTGSELILQSCTCYYFGIAQEKLTSASLWRKAAEFELNTLLPAPRNIFMLQTEAYCFFFTNFTIVYCSPE